MAVAEPDLVRYRTAEPNDALYRPGSYTGGMWHLPLVQAPAAWGTTTGSKQVKVW